MSGCISGARSLPGLPSVLRCLTLYHAFHSNSVLGPHQKSPSPADSSTQDHFQPPPSPAFLVVTISIVRLDNPTRRILRNELPFTAQSSLNETTRLLCSLPQIGRRYPVTHATQRKKKLIKIGLLYTHTHVCKHCAPPHFLLRPFTAGSLLISFFCTLFFSVRTPRRARAIYNLRPNSTIF
ncbi:hypothetical protein M408DRAFT_239333 [Serendipita vermifera MAFF 305830]|uniref:Uncharacterized protein n=1 Tax=Serendipita vermifera MAFF 305830 TaxID=933852 RepID=A0A0C2XSC0_SERVB|nr:hypothetical protein M408DRAFT_239333 [Serendipita vermifera MAFF 305830]